MVGGWVDGRKGESSFMNSIDQGFPTFGIWAPGGKQKLQGVPEKFQGYANYSIGDYLLEYSGYAN